jgi:hypothetical protein
VDVPAFILISIPKGVCHAQIPLELASQSMNGRYVLSVALALNFWQAIHVVHVSNAQPIPPQTQGAPTVVIHAPVVTQPPMSQCDPPGDDVRYAMTHPVNVREHGTKGGTSTINPYLVPPTTFQLDDALLESSNDVSHLILSYSLNKAVFSIAPCSEGFLCDAQFQNRIRRCNCSS